MEGHKQVQRKVVEVGKSSLAVVIPRQLADLLGISAGDDLTVGLEGKKLIFEKPEKEGGM